MCNFLPSISQLNFVTAIPLILVSNFLKLFLFCRLSKDALSVPSIYTQKIVAVFCYSNTKRRLIQPLFSPAALPHGQEIVPTEKMVKLWFEFNFCLKES